MGFLPAPRISVSLLTGIIRHLACPVKAVVSMPRSRATGDHGCYGSW